MVCSLAELAYGLLSPLTEFFQPVRGHQGKVQPLPAPSSRRGRERCPGPPCPIPPQHRGPPGAPELSLGQGHDCGSTDAQDGRLLTEHLINNCFTSVLPPAFFLPSLLINEVFSPVALQQERRPAARVRLLRWLARSGAPWPLSRIIYSNEMQR